MKVAKVCFTGPRTIHKTQSLAIGGYLTDYINLIIHKYDTCEFHVGDAKGVDMCVRDLLIQLGLTPIIHTVLDKSSKSAYAMRSMQMVNSCLEADKCMIFGFPNKECPEMITLRYPFCGSGSGTWATLAYAKSKGFYLNIHGLGRLSIPSWMSS